MIVYVPKTRRDESPVKGLSVMEVGVSSVREFIQKGHYLGDTISRGQYAFALYDTNNRLVGAALFDQPARESVSSSLWKGQPVRKIPNGPGNKPIEEPLKISDITLELTRFFTRDVSDTVHSNTGTWFLSRCVKILKNKYGIEMLVAFSDIGAGHFGSLYQAANWIYTGRTTPGNYHYVDALTGKRISKKRPWKIAKKELREGERPVDGEARVAKREGWIKVKDEPKFRYVLPLTTQAKNLLRYSRQDYPKPDVEDKRIQAKTMLKGGKRF